jgi:hypothetical protein
MSVMHLSGQARIIRGFSRLGIVLGALVALAGGLITLFVVSNDYSREKDRHQHAACIWTDALQRELPKADLAKIELQVDKTQNCSGPLYMLTAAELKALASHYPDISKTLFNFLAGAFISIIAGIVTFALCWLIGWTLGGFART